MANFMRFGEKMKQALASTALSSVVGSKDWVATPKSERNEAMITEARKFALHVKAMLLELKNFKGSVSSLLGVFQTVLTSSVPRVHDHAPGGPAAYVGGEQILGSMVDNTVLSATAPEFTKRIDAEAVAPLEKWLAVYRGIKLHNAKCEELRLDVDSHRRTVASLEESLKSGKDTARVTQKHQVESDLMNTLMQQYMTMEAEIFRSLLSLISESMGLYKQAERTMALTQECFQTAHGAFDVNRPAPVMLMPPSGDASPPSAMTSQGAPPAYGDAQHNNTGPSPAYNSNAPPAYGDAQAMNPPPPYQAYGDRQATHSAQPPVYYPAPPS